MEKVRKTTIVLMAMALMLALAAFGASWHQVSAAEQGNLTIQEKTGNVGTYKVYQIMTATQHGDGYNYTINDAYKTDVKAVLEGLGKTITDNQSYSTAIKGLSDPEREKFANEMAKKISAGSYTGIDFNGNEKQTIDTGYYLIVEQTNADVRKDGDAYSRAMTLTVEKDKDNVANVKKETPTVSKEVLPYDESTGENKTWNVKADYDIGDVFPFRIKTTLPSGENIIAGSAYDTYQMTLHDSMDKGLTYIDDSAKVYVGDVNDANLVTDTSQYSIVKGTDGDKTTLTVKFNDVKTLKYGADNKNIVDGQSITVEYNAKLNQHAVFGDPGNANEVYLTYRNDPNSAGEGKTKKVTNKVFTYKFVVNKKDSNGDPLSGAEFKLEKHVLDKNTNTAEWVAVESDRIEKNTAGNVFSFKGLDEGEYRLTETKVPETYVGIEPIVFKISSSIQADPDPDNFKMISLTTSATTTATFQTTNDVAGGTITTDVQNSRSILLPGTGGIGTVIFFVGGGIVAATAAVLLLRKKRQEQA